MWGDIAIAFVIAFIAAFMMTPQTIKLARKLGAVDTPKDSRRINKVPMPRLGGLAVIVGFIVSVVYLLLKSNTYSTSSESASILNRTPGFARNGKNTSRFVASSNTLIFPVLDTRSTSVINVLEIGVAYIEPLKVAL